MKNCIFYWPNWFLATTGLSVVRGSERPWRFSAITRNSYLVPSSSRGTVAWVLAGLTQFTAGTQPPPCVKSLFSITYPLQSYIVLYKFVRYRIKWVLSLVLKQLWSNWNTKPDHLIYWSFRQFTSFETMAHTFVVKTTFVAGTKFPKCVWFDDISLTMIFLICRAVRYTAECYLLDLLYTVKLKHVSLICWKKISGVYFNDIKRLAVKPTKPLFSLGLGSKATGLECLDRMFVCL